jgi:translation elongation factor EF-4
MAKPEIKICIMTNRLDVWITTGLRRDGYTICADSVMMMAEKDKGKMAELTVLCSRGHVQTGSLNLHGRNLATIEGNISVLETRLGMDMCGSVELLNAKIKEGIESRDPFFVKFEDVAHL